MLATETNALCIPIATYLNGCLAVYGLNQMLGSIIHVHVDHVKEDALSEPEWDTCNDTSLGFLCLTHVA